jgi:hypothetical protein
VIWVNRGLNSDIKIIAPEMVMHGSSRIDLHLPAKLVWEGSALSYRIDRGRMLLLTRFDNGSVSKKLPTREVDYESKSDIRQRDS